MAFSSRPPRILCPLSTKKKKKKKESIEAFSWIANMYDVQCMNEGTPERPLIRPRYSYHRSASKAPPCPFAWRHLSEPASPQR